MLEELHSKIKDPDLRVKIIKEANIDPKILRVIEKEIFCETFHKLPSEIDKMDVFDYDCFSAVLAGRIEANKEG